MKKTDPHQVTFEGDKIWEEKKGPDAPTPLQRSILKQEAKQLSEELKVDCSAVEIAVSLYGALGPEETTDFLNGFFLEPLFKAKVVSCIKTMDGSQRYACREAEICANANMLSRISPKSFFESLWGLAKKSPGPSEFLERAKSQLKKSYNLLSLPEAKKSAETYYSVVERFLELVE